MPRAAKAVIVILVQLLTMFCLSCGEKGPDDKPDKSSKFDDTLPYDNVSYDTAVFGYSEDAISTAKAILDGMTLEQKVGQLFLVRCPKNNKLEDIERYHFGGYILFSEDFKNETKSRIKRQTESFQNAAGIPMLIGVDEEGGPVVRISKYNAFRDTPFLSPRSLYDEGGFDLIRSDTAEKCKLLQSLGINLNLAPVCDISTDAGDYMYKRTLGAPAVQTAEYVKTVVETMGGYNIGSALKHFPGYGSNVDTHTGIATDNRSYETFQSSEFIPFRAGINAGAGCVLVSHNIIVCIDSKMPASLSSSVHEILRSELGFTGVVMTDDLYMDAINKFIGKEAAAVLAVKAGNDIIIATDYNVQIPAVIKAVNDGTVNMARINESVMRILLWKIALGII